MNDIDKELGWNWQFLILIGYSHWTSPDCCQQTWCIVEKWIENNVVSTKLQLIDSVER